MLISNILKGIHILNYNEQLTLEVSSISSDSRKAEKGCLFFAFKGVSFDSHHVAAQLYQAGVAKAVVAEHVVEGVPVIIVKNGRDAFARACSNYFGVSDKLLTIGVTGTNGKTTTTYLLESICEAAGIKSVIIGTVGARVPEKTYIINNTTPSAYDFHRFLAEGASQGTTAAVAEVSSHALEQHRLAGVRFDVAVFTNLSGEHLDYHHSKENYYQAKKLLFTDEYSKKRVINISNEYGKRLFNEVSAPKLSYGFDDGELRAESYSTDLSGTRADLSYNGKKIEIFSSLIGLYNLENILAACGAAIMAGIEPEIISKGVYALKNVPGRLEKYENNGISVFVDYAHTDDALKNVLKTLKNLTKGKLILVFGAGGDRDKSKRPRMGAVAEQYADIIVVTSDNPRTEDPNAIIEEILVGITDKKKVYVEPDRGKAIVYAIDKANAQDVVVIAGKGHEDYQIIGVDKYHFSDSETVQKYLGGGAQCS